MLLDGGSGFAARRRHLSTWQGPVNAATAGPGAWVASRWSRGARQARLARSMLLPGRLLLLPARERAWPRQGTVPTTIAGGSSHRR